MLELKGVAKALKPYGFQRRVTSADRNAIVYSGQLDTARGLLDCTVSIMRETGEPKLVLSQKGRAVLGRPVFPHIDSRRQVCVYEPAVFDFDVANCGGYIRAFMDQATDILSMTSETKIEDEIANDLTLLFSAKHAEHLGMCTEGYIGAVGPSIFGSKRWDSVGVERAEGALVDAEKLTFYADEELPTSCLGFLEWVECHDAAAATRMRALIDGASFNCPHFLLAVRSRGHIVGMRHGTTTFSPKEKEVFRKTSCRQLLTSGNYGRRTGERITFQLAHPVDLLHRDGAEDMRLDGRHVYLVGCGAIGGHLAPLLVQNGSGLGGGKLILVDPDTVSAPNTMRHRLGMNSVGLKKAEALRDELREAFPDADVEARCSTLSDQLGIILEGAIIVDATGEISVRDSLAMWGVRRRQAGQDANIVQHLWIEGNGAACASYITKGRQGEACARCVRASFLEDPNPRYKLVEGETVYEGAACGGIVYAPYAAQAAVMAASMGVQHLLQTLRGEAKGTLRTVQVDIGRSKHVKPATPGRLKDCPICANATVPHG